MRFDLDLVPADTKPYISVSHNKDTKRLAAWAAIIAVPTAIAGNYDMNSCPSRDGDSVRR